MSSSKEDKCVVLNKSTQKKITLRQHFISICAQLITRSLSHTFNQDIIQPEIFEVTLKQRLFTLERYGYYIQSLSSDTDSITIEFSSDITLPTSTNQSNTNAENNLLFDLIDTRSYIELNPYINIEYINSKEFNPFLNIKPINQQSSENTTTSPKGNLPYSNTIKVLNDFSVRNKYGKVKQLSAPISATPKYYHVRSRLR